MRGVRWIEWIASAIRALKTRVPTLSSEDTYDFGTFPVLCFGRSVTVTISHYQAFVLKHRIVNYHEHQERGTIRLPVNAA